MTKWRIITSSTTNIDVVTISLSEARLQIKDKVCSDWHVSTVTTSFLPIDQSAPISVGLYTNSSSSLEETYLQKHCVANLQLLISTEKDLPTSEVHLLSGTSAWAKYTWGEDTLPVTHIAVEKLSINWSQLIVAIHCALYIAFTIKNWHNSADWLQRL